MESGYNARFKRRVLVIVRVKVAQPNCARVASRKIFKPPWFLVQPLHDVDVCLGPDSRESDARVLDQPLVPAKSSMATPREEYGCVGVDAPHNCYASTPVSIACVESCLYP